MSLFLLNSVGHTPLHLIQYRIQTIKFFIQLTDYIRRVYLRRELELLQFVLETMQTSLLDLKSHCLPKPCSPSPATKHPATQTQNTWFAMTTRYLVTAPQLIKREKPLGMMDAS